MTERIVMVFADGFEEIEAVTPLDVLRRLGLNVVTAGLTSKEVRGAHDIVVQADILLSEIEASTVKMLILPGGMPGSINLRDSDPLMELIKSLDASGAFITAICAAPIALGRAGVITGKKVTCYPGFEDQLAGGEYTAARTERDGRIITGKGPGAAFEFTAEIAEALGKKPELEQAYGNMFIK